MPNASISGALIATIVISTILIVIISIAGLVFFLHRRSKRNKRPNAPSNTASISEFGNDTAVNEKEGSRSHRLEVLGDAQQRYQVTGVYEMYHPAVELAGSHVEAFSERGGQREKEPGWI
jgi:hypothetical protein